MDTRKKKAAVPGKGVRWRSATRRSVRSRMRCAGNLSLPRGIHGSRSGSSLRSSAAGLTEHTGRQQSIAMSAASGAESAEQIS